MPTPRNFPELETARLILRLPEPAEGPAVARFYRENEAHLAATSPKAPDGFYTEAYWVERLAKSREEFLREESVRFFLFEKESPKEIVGSVSFTQIFRGPFQACKLGYALAARVEGKGYMTEALRAAIGYAFGELNLHRIEAGYVTENARSGAVLERLGFDKLGVAKDYLLIAGQWREHVLTSLTHRGWKPS